MIGALVFFELKRRLKMLSTYVFAVMLFTIGAFLMAANAGLFSDLSAGAGNERVFANGPHSVFANQMLIALLGLFMVAAVFGQAASQDFTTGTWSLIFTRNVRPRSYLIGRFLGAYALAAALFLAIPAGQLFVALIAQLVDPSKLGPHRLDVYVWPWLVGVLPMLLITGVVFFALAALTRQMAPVYVGVVLLVLGYLVISTAIGDVSNRTIGALSDPFGFITLDVVTRYWTPAERNQNLVPLDGLFLGNKVIWVAASVALFALTVRRFSTTVVEHRGSGSKEAPTSGAPAAVPNATLNNSLSGWWMAAFRGGWLHFRDVVRSPVYWSFVAAGLLFLIIGIVVSKQLFGTATWAVTWQTLELARGSFGVFTLITLTFYAGELVWKERDAQLADIIDSSRVPTWVGFVSKASALFFLIGSLQFVIGGASLIAQVLQGTFDIEWRLYATELILFGLLKAITVAVLALVVQIVIDHKYLAHGAMVAYYLSSTALDFIGIEDPLLRFGSESRIQYSDLNGYGHWIPAVMTWRGYWWSWSVVLLLGAYAVMARGRESSLKHRLGGMRARLTLPLRAVLVVALLCAGSLGAFLFRETHLTHRYVTSKASEEEQADYEKTWRSELGKPTPKIIDSDVQFDVFPSEQPPRMRVSGTWTMENKTTEPIESVLVSWDEDAQREKLSVAGATVPLKGSMDRAVALFPLTPPMQPGEKRSLEFIFQFRSDTIRHHKRHDVVGNGTFFNNGGLPALGYQEGAELDEDGVRKKYDLKPKERMADRDDLAARQRHYISADSDFVGFRATVSTDADQIAVAPGTLVKDWKEGDRHFFRYEMDQPILNFFSVLSARYTVREELWNDVKLQIFYDAKHTWNLDHMMDGMKDALAYCSKEFGPYQHHQARILEFPRYESFAQSFPNTIPYSEAIGFIARVRPDNADDVDYPYYVTAHEIAHQWWAHQVVGGNVQGATMTSETMAQYSALMVMKHKFGPTKMRRFLKYELDHYLIGRAVEQKKEVPLSRVENQPYIHYQKGSLVMYWLQDLVGEDTVNRALARYVAAVKWKGPPYTNSTELLTYLRAEVPAEFHPVLDDLFETITLYDNRTVSASMKLNANGSWDVSLKVKAVKYRADEHGEQKELEFEDLMELGGLDEEGTAVCTERRKIGKGETDLVFSCDKRPARVGIDPLNKLIDRTSDDNTVAPSVD